MAEQTHSTAGPITLTALADVGVLRLVSGSVDSGEVKVSQTIAGATPLGVTITGARAGEDVSILRLQGSSGTFTGIAAGVIAIGAAVYAGANGTVSAVVDGDSIGMALSSAAAGDKVIVLPSEGLTSGPQPGDIDLFVWEDDFFSLNTVATTGEYVAAGDGTATVEDAHGGVIRLAATTTSNQLRKVYSVKKFLLPAAGQSITSYLRVDSAVHVSDDEDNRAMVVGFSSSNADTLAANTTGALLADQRGFGVHVAAGEASWRAWVSDTSGAATREDTGVASDDGFKTFRFDIFPDPADVTKWACTVTSGGSVVATFDGLGYGALAEMQFVAFIKGIDTPTGAPTLDVDAFRVIAPR